VGLFKGVRELAKLTKDAQKLQREQRQQAGYEPGMRGAMKQMGGLVSEAGAQVKHLADQSGERPRILAEGIEGEGVILGHGTPVRGAAMFNLDIDLEVHLPGRPPYRVSNMYMVSSSAIIRQGTKLPLRVDRDDPAKIAIDWDKAASPPKHGEIRPA